MDSNQHPEDSSEKNKLKIYTFLEENPVGVLSTVSSDGKPHAVVIYFTINDIFDITFTNAFDMTFTTKEGTKKVRNLKQNDHVMLIVFDTLTQTTVQITAIAHIITDAAEKEQALRETNRASLTTSHGRIPPIVKLSAGNLMAFKLKPVRIKMAVFKDAISGTYNEIYETVEFGM